MANVDRAKQNKTKQETAEKAANALKARKHAADKWWDVTDDGVAAIPIPEPKDDARKLPNYIRAPNEESAIAKMAARRVVQA
jgi:hypothetical protein